MILALLAALAHGEPAPAWWVGRPVAEVRLFAPEGGLPEETLDPLLRARQGDPIDPEVVRLDLNTLFRVGEFSGVEADVQPWFTYDAQGEIVDAVVLTYLVYPAPRVARARVEGLETVRARKLMDAVHLATGEVFHPEDARTVEADARALLASEGFPYPTVAVRAEELGEGELEVVLTVDEGERRLIDRLAFAGELPVPERRLRSWARQAGLREGGPLDVEVIPEVQYELRRKLARPATLFRPRAGWNEARVAAAVTGDGAGGTLVTYTLEPGRQLALDVEGLPPFRPPKVWVRRALGIDERLRLTRGFLEQAPERMEDYLQRRGFLTAEVRVELAKGEKRQVLHVDVDRGPVHRLSPGGVLFRSDLSFTGNTAIDGSELRALATQTSEEVLRLGYVTLPELNEATAAIEALYASKGYLEARASVADLNPDAAPQPLRNPAGWLALRTGIEPRPRRVTARVHIDEGPLTTLRGLDIEGSAADLAALTATRAALVGAPYSPARLELLARRIVDEHRANGWLQADARVVPHRVDGETYDAAIVVRPGTRVRLRSIVTRGARRSNVTFLRRQLDLELGQPLTSIDLARMRDTLYDLGAFSTVTTELLGDEEARDLVLVLEERARVGVEVGAGFATDQGLRAFGRVTRRNLWGRAHRIEANALLGVDNRGESLLRFLPRSPEFRAAMSYTAPHFPLRGQDLVVDVLFQERLQERTYELARTGGGLFVDSQLGPNTELRAGVRLEGRRIVQIDPGVVLPGEIWTRMEGRTWRPQHTLTAVALHDLRDDPLAPTRGALFSVQGDFAPDIPLAKEVDLGVSFVRGEARASGFVPLGGLTLKLSGEVGYARMLKGGVLPVEDRYQLGGTGTLRGFKRDSAGPRQEVGHIDLDWPDALGPVVDVALSGQPNRWVPVGGDTKAVALAELVVPLPALGLAAWDGWSAAVFSDVGNVWLADPVARSATSDAFRPALRYGLGAGLRVATPVGPLQLDLGTNLHALTADPALRKLLREQWEEPPFRAHVSLGTLF